MKMAEILPPESVSFHLGFELFLLKLTHKSPHYFVHFVIEFIQNNYVTVKSC